MLLDTDIDDNSYRHRAIMGDHNITFHYSLAEHVELPVGAYCLFEGQRYTLERPEAFTMKHSRNFEYTVTMESVEAKAKIYKFRNPVDGRLKFTLTAKPKEHLQMFVDNMNRRDTGWTVGDCVEGTEVMISYNHNYCKEALSMMASEFNTEYEIVGKRVSLKKIEYNKNNPLALSYGHGNGFRSGVGRSNTSDKQPVEILFVQGGSENIDLSKYGSSELHLPKNQTIQYDGEYFETDSQFNPAHARTYVVDDKGLSIRRADKQLTTGVEDSLDASDIYPKREGRVTSVVVVNAEKNFYDIVDNTIPDTLDFNEYLIEGNKLTVIFQSGMLVTRKFEVTYFHTVADGKLGKRFELVPIEEDGLTMPSGDFVPVSGDIYAVFNCQLPDSYICDNATKTGAEWDMFKTAVRYMYENEDVKYTFKGELDGIWAKKSWENIGAMIKLGGFIDFSDVHFQQSSVLVRIVGIKDYINNPHSPELELSNSTVTGGFSSTLNELKGQEVVSEEYHRDSIQFTKRRFRDAQETISMLEDALLTNFTESINPLSVQTMSMLVGDESLQYRFVNSKTNPTTVPCNIAYNQETKQLVCAAGIMQHLTLGIKNISPQHSASEYKYWDVALFNSAAIDDATKKYYLYIKASRTTSAATYILSETAIGMNDNGNYYHFLVGVLNSEYDNERSFVTLYGYTEVLPGRITTDRLVSSEGTSYFDMLNDAMKLGSALDFNSQGDGKLRLKGTLVQSQSGTESYIGCYRGVYNSATTYFAGDEVTYTITVNNVDSTSTYRYYNDTASNGHAPTDTNYWQVIAKGANGADGSSVRILGTKISSSELPTTGNTAGDGYLIDGYLWAWDGTSWNNVGKIKGEDGKDGTDGNFTELRFAKNGSTKSAPSLSTTSVSPIGWSLTMPAAGTAEYVWMTSAIKNGAGTALVQNWSTPIRITPYNGKDGADGKSPAMVYRGVYDSGKTYYGNSNRIDCVKSGTEYYVACIDAGTFSNVAPPDTGKWNDFGASFESVATNLLLAENANIAGWVFRNNRLESENGKVYLDGKTGKVRLAGTIQLSTGWEGDYSDVNIMFLPPITVQKYIYLGCDIEDIGKVIRFYNNSKFSGANYLIECYKFTAYEDGAGSSMSSYAAALYPQEIVEMTCFEREAPSNGAHYGRWEITSRFSQRDFYKNGAKGRHPLMLALGHVYGTNAATASISGYFYDGRSIGSLFTVSRIGEGQYKISFKSGLLGSDYWVIPWGYGYINNGSNMVNASIRERGTNYFIVDTADDSSRNDANFEFMIYGNYWYYDLID